MSQDDHALDDSLALTGNGDGTLTGKTSPAFNNMVGPYGGNTAAVLLSAALDHPERLGDPVSLTVNFAGPIAEGEFTVAVRPVRTNRSTQHFSLELRQDDVVATTATAVFAVRRDTWSSTEARMPAAPAAADVPEGGFPPGIRWTENYEMRFVAGPVPAPGDGRAEGSTTTMWIRDRPPRPLDFRALTGICDSFYPRAFLRLGAMLPAGTVSLTVYFHADADTVAAQGTDPVLGTARSSAFGKGFFDQVAQIWGADETLLATSHQLVYFKA